MVPQENPVRLIDLMCKKFVSDNLLRNEWKGNKNDGKKSYPPDSMLSLLVYGYFDGVASSRKLEKETLIKNKLIATSKNLKAVMQKKKLMNESRLLSTPLAL